MMKENTLSFSEENKPPAVLSKIRSAKAAYARHGGRLSQDEEIFRLLDKYRRAIQDTHGAMNSVNMVAACGTCAEEMSGSCCSQTVEDWYDPLLLFINLLLGIQLPETREIPGHCIFVGHAGCKLSARYSFCINYLCPRLKEALTPVQSADFLSVAGREIYCGWELERMLMMRTDLRSF